MRMKILLMFALLAVAVFTSIDRAEAQVPEPTATPVTTLRNLTVSASEQAVGYVYPNGVVMFVVRWNLSPGEGIVTSRYPFAADVVTYSIEPPAAGTGAQGDIVVRPAIVPTTTGSGSRGWGRGLGIGICYCYSDMRTFDEDTELGLSWTLTRELNAEYVATPVTVSRSIRLNSFLETDYSAPEAAVRTAINAVNRDQPATLLDGNFLSQAGEVYLASYALDLQVLLPSLYITGAQAVPLPTPGTFAGVDVPMAGIDGQPTDNPIAAGLEGIQGFLGTDSVSQVSGLAWAGFAIVLTVISAVLTKNAIFPVCTLVFVLLAGVALGWTPMWVAVVIMVMSAIALGWILFLKKGVGA